MGDGKKKHYKLFFGREKKKKESNLVEKLDKMAAAAAHCGTRRAIEIAIRSLVEKTVDRQQQFCIHNNNSFFLIDSNVCRAE